MGKQTRKKPFISNSVWIPSNFFLFLLSFFAIAAFAHPGYPANFQTSGIRNAPANTHWLPPGARPFDDRCKLIKCVDLNFAVCGTDHKQYVNKCHLKRAICMAENRGKYLALKHTGECTKAEIRAGLG